MIYFIGNKDKNICKIGVSIDPQKRLKEIQCYCPFDVEIFMVEEVSDDYFFEKLLHNKYSKYNTRGEWFELSPITEILNGIVESDLYIYSFDNIDKIEVSPLIKDLINWRELSRKLTGNDNSIRSNKCPKKYEKKVSRLLKIVDAWYKWVSQ